MRKASNPNYVKFTATETVVTFATDRGQLRRDDSGEFFYRDLSDVRFTCIDEELERKLIAAECSTARTQRAHSRPPW